MKNYFKIFKFETLFLKISSNNDANQPSERWWGKLMHLHVIEDSKRNEPRGKICTEFLMHSNIFAAELKIQFNFFVLSHLIARCCWFFYIFILVCLFLLVIADLSTINCEKNWFHLQSVIEFAWKTLICSKKPQSIMRLMCKTCSSDLCNLHRNKE